MEFAGEFETHITVLCRDEAASESLRVWGEGRGFRFHHILLDRGRFASQPMLTRYGLGCLSDERAIAARTSRALGDSGFRVVRVKIEAAPWNEEVPQTAADAATQPSDRYFEHHVKLLLTPHVDLPALSSLAEIHSAHLSRNTRRVRDDGQHERFVTQRCPSTGRAEATAQLSPLLDAIRLAGYTILETETEYVVYDSNLALDTGWIVPRP